VSTSAFLPVHGFCCQTNPEAEVNLKQVVLALIYSKFHGNVITTELSLTFPFPQFPPNSHGEEWSGASEGLWFCLRIQPWSLPTQTILWFHDSNYTHGKKIVSHFRWQWYWRVSLRRGTKQGDVSLLLLPTQHVSSFFSYHSYEGQSTGSEKCQPILDHILV